MQIHATTTASHFYVRSSKNPHTFYEVATEASGFLRCSCPAAVYRPTKPCRHIRSVVAGECLVAKPKAPAPRPTVARARVSEEGARYAAALEV